MSLLASVIMLAALGDQASGQPQRWQGVQAVEVLAAGEPMAERRVERARPFHVQHLLREEGVLFDITPAEFEALRDRFDLRRTVPFVLYEWREYESRLEGPPVARHLGYLYCSSRVTWGTTTTCLRDADSDGRLESVSVFQFYDFPDSGLQFQPIEPVPYHYVQQPLVPVETSGGNHADAGLVLAWNYEEGNRESGRLRFFAQLNALTFGSPLNAEIDPQVMVDVSRLPATIEVAGAQITIVAWDGRRPTVRVDRPMPARAIRVRPSRNSARLLLGGRTDHWTLEEMETPLPGSPADDPAE
jgi:hypothetical protein